MCFFADTACLERWRQWSVPQKVGPINGRWKFPALKLHQFYVANTWQQFGRQNFPHHVPSTYPNGLWTWSESWGACIGKAAQLILGVHALQCFPLFCPFSAVSSGFVPGALIPHVFHVFCHQALWVRETFFGGEHEVRLRLPAQTFGAEHGEKFPKLACTANWMSNVRTMNPTQSPSVVNQPNH